MKPKPWSHSSLDTLLTCERKYFAEKIAKTVPFEQSEMQLYGLRIHKAFEDFHGKGTDLPADLRHHQPFMNELSQCTDIKLERKVALNTKLQPIEINDWYQPMVRGEKVWWRGAIDFDGDVPASHPHLKRALIADYKTGKSHSKMMQLHEYAIYKFCEGYDEVEVMYYWTQDRTTAPRIVIPKEHMSKLLNTMMPGLKQWVAAHQQEVWRPRKNGLCKKYCGVKDCEFWGG